MVKETLLALVLMAAAAPASDAQPAAAVLDAITLQGTIKAIDKDRRTVTLQRPEAGELTLAVQDPSTLDAVRVGDAVVARYYEAIVLRVWRGGSAPPAPSSQEAIVSSNSGEMPGEAVEYQITVTTTVAAMDTKAQTVVLTSPDGFVEKVKVRDTRLFETLDVGDVVEVTYARALAISLDRK
jgi:Cu/Ag efflux protein CusF